ncbi:hypothetical protein LCGC14_2825980, partial [marine sediment metagenome]
MNKYQNNFSKIYQGSSLHDIAIRHQKAKKTISILEDYLEDIKPLSVLDIGCSNGLMTELYAEKFKKVIGIDIDKSAVEFAIQHISRTNVEFYVKDSMDTGFEDESFDLILSDPPYTKKDSEIYGCPPFPIRKFVKEAHRVLRKGGYLGMLHTYYPSYRKADF